LIEGCTKTHPIELAEVARLAGYTRRAVAAIVERLRKSGYQIGSSRRKPRGLYILRDLEELRATLRSYLAQVRAMASTARGLVPSELREWLDVELHRIVEQPITSPTSGRKRRKAQCR
jgi:biotin operon repressor